MQTFVFSTIFLLEFSLYQFYYSLSLSISLSSYRSLLRPFPKTLSLSLRSQTPHHCTTTTTTKRTSLSLSLSLFVFPFSITHFSLTSFKNWILCKMSDGYEKYSFAGAVSISIAAGQAETTRFPINPYYMNLWWCSILIWWCSTLIIPLGLFPINPWKSFYCH